MGIYLGLGVWGFKFQGLAFRALGLRVRGSGFKV